MITPTKKELWDIIQRQQTEIKQLNKELKEEAGWCKYWEGIAKAGEGRIVIADLMEEEQ